MTSPLPGNAKQNSSDGSDESSSSQFGDPSLSSPYERNRATAKLTSSPVPPNATSGYSSSPPSTTENFGFVGTGFDGTDQSYGSTTDLQQSLTNHSGTGSFTSTGIFRPMSTPTYNYDDNTVSADMSDDRIARVVKRHLAGASSPTGSARSSSPKKALQNELSRVNTNNSTTSQSNRNTYGRQQGNSNDNIMEWHSDPTSNNNNNNDDGDGAPSLLSNVHQLSGGAITHDIYKWADDMDFEQCKRQRSQSMYIPRQEPSDPALARLKDPGGFRRHFVVDKAAKQGKEPPHWMTRTFVDFLALYGHFGGEDLSDDDDEEGGDDDDDDDLDTLIEEGSATHAGLTRRRRRRQQQDGGDDGGDDDETSPLIRKAQANAVQGSATPSKAVFLLLKSFVGTGVMFLPKAFSNGGLFFSTALLFSIAVLSLYTFLLLVETRNKVPVSFGDIGGILFGKYMRMAVLVAITFSQIGFVCAYMVFVAQNMQSLIEAISQCEVRVPLSYLILGQIALFVPLAMIRKIQKLSAFALVADLFILLGLLYLYYYDFLTLATQGAGNVEWFINAKSFPLFIGTAVFSFEGVGLGNHTLIIQKKKKNIFELTLSFL
ncbi:unnamed protein product [Absidia cylindrospora]